jgi:hypothetical protein
VFVPSRLSRFDLSSPYQETIRFLAHSQIDINGIDRRVIHLSPPADRAPSDAKSATPCREVRRSPRSRGRSEGEPSKGLKRDSEDECIAGTNKRQKLREGSHLDLPAAESNAPAKSKLKSSSHPGD